MKYAWLSAAFLPAGAQPGPNVDTRLPSVDRAGLNRIEALRARTDRQNLLIQALLALLLEKGVLAREETAQWLRYVDAIDGERDGRLAEPDAPVPCPACGRANRPTAGRCLYCAAAIELPTLDPRLARTEAAAEAATTLVTDEGGES